MRKIIRDILFSLATLCLLLACAVYIYFVAFRKQGDGYTPKSIVQSLPKETLWSMKEGDDNALKRYLGLQSIDGDWAFYTAKSMMDVDELLIVRFEDGDSQDDVQRAVESRIATQKKTFNGYGTNQTMLLENAIVTQKGNYLFYAVGENAEKWEDVFSEKLKD